MVCNRGLKPCKVTSAPAIATASSSSSSRPHPSRSQQQGSEEVEEEVVREKEKTDEKVFALCPVMQLGGDRFPSSFDVDASQTCTHVQAVLQPV